MRSRHWARLFLLRSVVVTLLLGAFIWTTGVSAVCARDADFRYLAADPSLRETLANASPQMGQATHMAKMLELDQPWEDPFNLGYVGSVVNDPDSGQWRMYYELGRKVNSKERLTAVAFSDDGLNWTKPELNITGDRYTTDPRNNFINRPGAMWLRGPKVFIEPDAPPSQRYGCIRFESALADWRNWLKDERVPSMGGDREDGQRSRKGAILALT